MTIHEYLNAVSLHWKSGIATEHSYRGDLQLLLSAFAPGCAVTNEPRRQACGAPDYIVERKGIPVGFVEAKDLGLDLGKVEASEQLGRYRASLDNLVLTDYLEFRFYHGGAPVDRVRIAETEGKKLRLLPDNFGRLEALLRDFAAYGGTTIKSPEKLARMMADKARLMEDITLRALESGEEESEGLTGQYAAFKSILIHDLEKKQFADIYAQTIAYGLFAARLNDPSLESFTRQEAGYLVPKTNPFLFQLFSYIAGPTLDDRVAWVVDALAEVFRACDVPALLVDFGKETRTEDPFIHFYETFLAEYDPALRKSRGVYYTPEPVVSFIVRSVDKILERGFGLPRGLADTSRTTIEVEKQGHAGKTKESVHRVQLLDPACGTGTFLMEVLKRIHARFEGQEGLWSSYVEEDLLPRLHGFEILMAPYAMCHLKLGLFLTQTGYKPRNPQRPKRLGVYLTNALEEAHPDTGSLFASWLTQEASAANIVKRDAPVMVVLGNPPYANFGQMNKGEWIRALIADYKKDLNEKKINLDDDYIKFLRYAEHFIEKNGHGVLAMITNNSYLDGITHRRMREHLMSTFEEIYVLDLHGSAKKKEVAPDGGKDENVFDIQQGVAIVLMVKKGGRSKKPATVRHAELYGLREAKYHELWQNDISRMKWKELKPETPNWFFGPKDFSIEGKYREGIKCDQLFPNYNSGIQTKCDDLSVHFSIKDIQQVVKSFREEPLESLKQIYCGKAESSGWNFADAKSDLTSHDIKYCEMDFRPFDKRYSVFTGFSGGFIGRPRTKTLIHILEHRNWALEVPRQVNGDFHHAFIASRMPDINYTGTAGQFGGGLCFPLYLYPDPSDIPSDSLFSPSSSAPSAPLRCNSETSPSGRRPNLDPAIVSQIAERLSLRFIPDHEAPEAKTPTGRRPKGIFTPLDLLDYIYAVLHAPSYREKYKELLKIDFPRVPWPRDAESFFALGEKGAELRALHLMEAPALQGLIMSFPTPGSNQVDKVEWEGPEEGEPEALGRVFINKEQCFDKVPRLAWDFWIGGYQPCRKWLKDRKGRILSSEELLHWQRIVVALVGTARLMGEIESVYTGSLEA